MPSHTVVIEADSVEEAREKLKPQVSPGLSVLSEEIISDGRLKTATAVAETPEAAAIQARAVIPPGAVVVSQTDASAPQFSTITVEAFDEAEALAEARTTASRIGHRVLVKEVTQLTPGTRGFLGVGKKRGKWTAELFHQAVCELSYQAKARVRFKIGKEPKTVVTVLREFLIENEEDIQKLGGMRSLEFIDILRGLVNSNFSVEVTRSALQRGGRMGELTRKFLEQVERETR